MSDFTIILQNNRWLFWEPAQRLRLAIPQVLFLSCRPDLMSIGFYFREKEASKFRLEFHQFHMIFDLKTSYRKFDFFNGYRSSVAREWGVKDWCYSRVLTIWWNFFTLNIFEVCMKFLYSVIFVFSFYHSSGSRFSTS